MSAVTGCLTTTVFHPYTRTFAAGVVVVVALTAIGATAASFIYPASKFFAVAAVTSFKTALATKVSALAADLLTILAASALALGLLTLAAKIRPQQGPVTPKGSLDGSGKTGT